MYKCNATYLQTLQKASYSVLPHFMLGNCSIYSSLNLTFRLADIIKPPGLYNKYLIQYNRIKSQAQQTMRTTNKSKRRRGDDQKETEMTEVLAREWYTTRDDWPLYWHLESYSVLFSCLYAMTAKR